MVPAKTSVWLQIDSLYVEEPEMVVRREPLRGRQELCLAHGSGGFGARYLAASVLNSSIFALTNAIAWFSSA